MEKQVSLLFITLFIIKSNEARNKKLKTFKIMKTKLTKKQKEDINYNNDLFNESQIDNVMAMIRCFSQWIIGGVISCAT